MNAIAPKSALVAATGGDEHACVTLYLAGQLCGVPVACVRDILGPQTITRIPLAPPEIAGSLNLRGRIVTAIDLRLRLALPPADAGVPRRSVVTDHGGDLYALLVDDVSEVIRLSPDLFERNPATLPASWAAFSAGIYRLQGQLLVLLDVARVLALAPDAEAETGR